MPVPNQSEIMNPLLELVSDGQEYRIRDIIDRLADHFSLTGEERMERVPSGEGRFRKNCQWAEFNMTQNGLLESTRRGHHRITEQGREVLRQNSSARVSVNEEIVRQIVTAELGENLAAFANEAEDAIRRIVREEIDRVKQEVKIALREVIDRVP